MNMMKPILPRAITSICASAAGAVALSGLASAAAAEPLQVTAFQYFSPAQNRTVSLPLADYNTMTFRPAQTLALEKLEEAGVRIVSAALHCAGNPGPRFAQINGQFYQLNGKSDRKDATAVTHDGSKHPIQDAEAGPLKDQFEVIQMLIDEAKWAC